MSDFRFVVGWCDTYNSNCNAVPFTKERQRALVDQIRKRKYNFTFYDYQYLPYCCPVYNDGTICILTKQQFDDTMQKSWKNLPLGARLIPMDVITLPPHNGILYEKAKFIKENK